MLCNEIKTKELSVLEQLEIANQGNLGEEKEDYQRRMGIKIEDSQVP